MSKFNLKQHKYLDLWTRIPNHIAWTYRGVRIRKYVEFLWSNFSLDEKKEVSEWKRRYDNCEPREKILDWFEGDPSDSITKATWWEEGEDPTAFAHPEWCEWWNDETDCKLTPKGVAFFNEEEDEWVLN